MPQLSVSYGILIDNTWPSTTTTTATPYFTNYKNFDTA